MANVKRQSMEPEDRSVKGQSGMSRKRFIKLLMGRRWTRNEANEIAMNVYAYGRKKDYARYYRFVAINLKNGRA